MAFAVLVWPVPARGPGSDARDEFGGYTDSRERATPVKKATYGCAKRPPPPDHRRNPSTPVSFLFMLFRSQSSGVLAISQPTHAWISGQILRAWDENFGETLLLASEQHDIGWLDWEIEPTFNPSTGRPHLFREVGAAAHAPMWTLGVQRARDAWGTHVALLVSRHGGVIYRRFIDRHRISEADTTTAQNYLDAQAPIERAWARALGLEALELEKETGLIAFADTLSLALCGDLKPPLDLEAPTRGGDTLRLRLAERPGSSIDFVLSPWPFRTDELAVEGEARPLPKTGRLSDEAAMRHWMAFPDRVVFRARLRPQ